MSPSSRTRTVRGAAALLGLVLLVTGCGRSDSGSGTDSGADTGGAAAESSTPSSPAAGQSSGAVGSSDAAGSSDSAADASASGGGQAPSSSAMSQTGESGTAAESGTASAAGAAPADLLPADIKKAGVLKVATAEGYPPMEMYAEGTNDLIGVDPELGKLLADELGLKFEITNTSFPGLIPGLQSGQWDVAMSSMSDTAERRKAVNFVDYFTTGGAIMVVKGNPEGIKDIADLCGKNVVAGKGSSNLAILQDYSKDSCGDNPMKVSESEDAPTGLLQLDTDRAVATMVDYPVAVQMANKAGKYEVLEKQYSAGPWGIAIDKRDMDLTKAVQAALANLIQDGRYGKLLTKYNVSGSAVDAATINAGN